MIVFEDFTEDLLGVTLKVGEHSLVLSTLCHILTSFYSFSLESIRDIPVSKSGGKQQSG